MKKIFRFIIFYLLLITLSFSINLIVFIPIFKTDSLIFPYAIHEFDICKLYPDTWSFLKKVYIITTFISYSLLIHKFLVKTNFWKKSFYKKTISHSQNVNNKRSKQLINNKEEILSRKEEGLNLIVGTDDNNNTIKIEENGLYQNILITGTIGSGKTSSAMYPFTRQLMEYKADHTKEKIAMLVLDVKGNYNKELLKYSEEYNRKEDVVCIDITGKIKYNPLDKPDLKPIVLANRLKTILTLFNKNNSESYWLDKAEQILTECIKFCRLYNDGYVNFIELHKLVMFPDYYQTQITKVREKFNNGLLDESEVYNLLSCINFFEKEFFSLDNRTISILKSEISRITNIFVSDYFVSKTFCSKKEDINFKGFDDVLDKGKIVVLNMNIAEYKNLSKIIATYLKLDFQSTVMNRLTNNKMLRVSAFICDEYHEYVTDTDTDFFAQSREAKCINIIASQSYSSLLNTVKDEITVKTIIQNLINKIWFRTDDIFTIEEAQKQIGKEEKEKISTTISESAKQTDYNLFTKKFISRDSNLSESYSKHTENDFVYDTNFFSQNLKTFTALAFLSDGYSIKKPQKLNMIPYFKNQTITEKRNNKMKGFDLNEE